MMEKYGVERDTYEVVVPTKDGDYELKGAGLNLSEANQLQEKIAKAIVRPE